MGEVGNDCLNETFDDILKIYMKYHGFNDVLEINKANFTKWLEERHRKHLNETYGITLPVEEYDDMSKIIEHYCEENGCEAKLYNMDWNKLQEWCQKKEMKIPSKMKKFFIKREEQRQRANSNR